MTSSIRFIGTGAVAHAIANRMEVSFNLTPALYGRDECEVDPLPVRTPENHQNALPRVLDERVMFMCTKSYDIAPALQQWRSSFREDTSLIIVANGYWHERIRDQFADLPSNVLAATTTFACKLSQSRDYFFFSNPTAGKLYAGPLRARDRSIDIGVSWFQSEDNIDYWMRKKWLFNTVLNSLAAANDLPRNGDVLALRDYPALFNETLALSHQLWTDSWHQISAGELRAELDGLVQQTAENMNSMVADLREKRRLEIDDLSGLVRGFTAYPLLKKIDEDLQSRSAMDSVPL